MHGRIGIRVAATAGHVEHVYFDAAVGVHIIHKDLQKTNYGDVVTAGRNNASICGLIVNRKGHDRATVDDWRSRRHDRVLVPSER